MSKYKIAFDITLCGEMFIEANSLEEAKEKAKEAELPAYSSMAYIDDSFTVNEQMTEYFNTAEE